MLYYNLFMDFSRKLPIGIQDFEVLRKNGYLYVDKTSYVYQLVQEGKPYFLSRPRRFGKSLFLSTLEAYFLGKKELFKGLEIEKYEKEWIEYPVIKISFEGNEYETTEKLLQKIDSILNKYEKKFEIENNNQNYAIRFSTLIRSIYEKTGKQVVILIDEYDKPIQDAIFTEYEEKNSAILRAFYSPLKDSDKYIHFTFITGLTKLSHLNCSELNHLDNISMNKSFSSICGVSESELKEYFMPEIEGVAKEQGMTVEEALSKLAAMYGGYHFTHNVEGVCNPFGLLKCFNDKQFDSYWFEKCTPSLLLKVLKKQPHDLSGFVNGRKVTELSFKEYDSESKNIIPLLYQSGYLTIKGFDKEDRLFMLNTPNNEVEKALTPPISHRFTLH